MDKVVLLIGIGFVLFGGISIWNKEVNRIKFNNKVFNNRIEELKEIITNKDITYRARIEELLYMKDKFY